LRQLVGKRALGYVSWHRFRKHKHRAEVMAVVLADLEKLRPDLVLITGDLVNISLQQEFAAARRLLERLGPPERVVVVPGNHDAYVPGAAERHWREWLPWMGGGDGRAEPVFPFVERRGALALIGLSTAVPTAAGFASGVLGARQLEALRVVLARLRGQGVTRIVLLHHPPLDGWSLPRKALTDAAEFREVIAAEGAELVLCGHEHVLKVGALAGPAGPVPVVAGPAATLVDPEGKGVGGYLRLTIAAAGPSGEITAEIVRYDPSSGGLRPPEPIALAHAVRVGCALAPA
jgi:3',5'-cyclic AMP phosphodiesterase CpdA